MNVKSMDNVYLGQLKDLLSVEKQLTAALEQLAEAASNEELRSMFEQHREETEGHQQKVSELLEALGTSTVRQKCKGIAGIIEEGESVIKARGDDGAKDAALIGAAQKAEHYEIATYGTAVAMARQLGRENDARVLQEILDQEKQTDRKLTSLATGEVNPEAAGEQAGGESARTTSRSKGQMMARNDYYDEDRGYRGGYEGRSEGGRRSSHMQERDDYGQFQGSGSRGGSSRGGYDDDDSGSRGGGRFGGYEGRSEGGYRSSQMQDRDEYGQFQGYSGSRGSSRGGYDDGGSRGGYGNGGSRGGYSTDSAGRGYSRDSWERAQEGRSLGGQHSQGGGRGGYDDDDSGSRGGSMRGGYRGGYEDNFGTRGGVRSGEHVDSAGRHYTQDSWERAQEGRSLGGQHSHGGGRRGYGRDDY